MKIPHLIIKGLHVKGRIAPFSTTLPCGQLVHLIGPNGSGKSSLMLRLAGLIDGNGEAWLGKINLHALNPRALSRYRACLIQQHSPDCMTPVFAYLGFHAPYNAMPDALDNAVNEITSRLGLRKKLKHPINQLSGGEWQRVRLAAVFIQIWPSLNPDGKLLILDEPMTGLDIVQQSSLDNLISDICTQGILVIASSHELNHTLHHADEVWMVKNGKVIMCAPCSDAMQEINLKNLYDANVVTKAENYTHKIFIKIE